MKKVNTAKEVHYTLADHSRLIGKDEFRQKEQQKIQLPNVYPLPYEKGKNPEAQPKGEGSRKKKKRSAQTPLQTRIFTRKLTMLRETRSTKTRTFQTVWINDEKNGPTKEKAGNQNITGQKE